VTAGSHKVALAYTNDAYKNASQDRNLYLDRLTVVRVATTLTVSTKALFAGGQRLAAKESTGALRVYHGDHLGSSNVITDATGAVVEAADYTPFGAVIPRPPSPAPRPFGFTGQRLDATGLYFYQARYYDPSIGRFVSADPLVQEPSDPQLCNRYSYVRNNPVNLVDPSGYVVEEIAAFLGNPVVGLIAAIGLGLFQTLGRRKGGQPDVSSLLRDTGVRFLRPVAPLPLPNSFSGAAASRTLLHASRGLGGGLDAFAQSEAYRTLVQVGVSPVAAALHAHQQIQANLVGVSQAAADFYHSAPGLNITNAALRRGADVLSQLPSRQLGIAVGAGLAGTGALGDEAAGVLSRSPVNSLRGLGNVVTIGLTVNEVHQTFQDPNLSWGEQNQRAGIQVGAMIGKFTVSAAVRGAVGLTATALGVSAGGPLTFGIIAVGSGIGATAVDKVKDWLLRERRLLH
jgi:RHS repeat-associated protein